MTSATEQPAAASPRHHSVLGRTFSALEHRGYRYLWLSSTGAALTMQMQLIARGYLAYEISGTAVALGVVTLAWGAPMLLLSPVAGVVVDRVPKRNLVLVSQAALGVATLVTALLVSTGLIEIWHLVAAGLVQGSVFAFNLPARQALVPEVVGPELMANAIALNSAGNNITRILGPSAAGVFIAVPFVGIAGVFYLIVGVYALVIAALFQVPAAAAPAAAVQRGDFFKEATSGLRYIWRNPPLRTPMALAFVPVLLAMPYHSLMPVFAKDAFGVGSEGLGFLMGAGGAGALIGSLLVAFFSEHPNKNQIQLITGVLFGVALATLASAPVFPLGLAAMLAVGGASSTYLALNNTIILTNCDPKMHGRVMSIYFTTLWANAHQHAANERRRGRAGHPVDAGRGRRADGRLRSGDLPGVARCSQRTAPGVGAQLPSAALRGCPPALVSGSPEGAGPASGESREVQPHWQAVWRMCLHNLLLLTCPLPSRKGAGGWSQPSLRQHSPERASRGRSPLAGVWGCPQR